MVENEDGSSLATLLVVDLLALDAQFYLRHWMLRSLKI